MDDADQLPVMNEMEWRCVTWIVKYTVSDNVAI